VIIGAYTPTEAQLASEAGADFIKIFPAETLGAGYIKSLLAPLPHLRCVPTGGVDLRNIGEFIKAGCAAVGVGSSLMPGKMLKEENWPELSQNAKAFVSAAQRART
jgi:2-dehydro-3-deoxyphosphogluconate aldolase/(4S)-4-hydroxy-2-oxoglutarate aldolase